MHAAPRRTLGGLLRAGGPSVLALAIAAAIVGLVLVVNGRSGDPGGSPAVIAASGHPSHSSARHATAAAGTPSSPAASTSKPATTPAHPSATMSTSAGSTAPPSARTHAPPRPPLTVLNNSRIRGLAQRVATDFAGDGWTIADVGNFTGRIPQTTVYYPRGGHAAAERLAKRFPKVTRVLPRFARLPGSGLTVVLTRYYTHPR